MAGIPSQRAQSWQEWLTTCPVVRTGASTATVPTRAAPAQQLASAGAGRAGRRWQRASPGSSAASLKIDEKKPSVSEQLVTRSSAQGRKGGREGGS